MFSLLVVYRSSLYVKKHRRELIKDAVATHYYWYVCAHTVFWQAVRKCKEMNQLETMTQSGHNRDIRWRTHLQACSSPCIHFEFKAVAWTLQLRESLRC